jgi:hypothetical protein
MKIPCSCCILAENYLLQVQQQVHDFFAVMSLLFVIAGFVAGGMFVLWHLYKITSPKFQEKEKKDTEIQAQVGADDFLNHRFLSILTEISRNCLTSLSKCCT